MKHFLSFIAVLGLLLTACNSEQPVLTPSSEGSASCRISPVQAAEIALSARDALDATPTRNSRSIKTLTAIADFSSTNTRAQDVSDTLLYIINFDNDEGFAIVGADARTLPIYAISDEGELDITSPSNEATIEILNNIASDAQSRINITPIYPIDSVHVNIPIDRPAFLTPKYGPYLSLHQRRIKPCVELSKYCFDKDGNQGHTGCPAVAVEQYLSFFKWPLSYNGYQFDWDKINNGEDDDMIARIFALLGLPNNLNMTYEGPNVIGYASTLNFARTLVNFEYTTQYPYFSDFFFFEEEAQETLKSQPILCTGMSRTNKSGHAWVIDGLYQYKAYNWQTDSYDTKYSLYHCCWGDEGKCDGYYYVADTQTFCGVPDMLDPSDSGDFSNAVNQMHEYSIGFIRGVVPNYDSIVQPH